MSCHRQPYMSERLLELPSVLVLGSLVAIFIAIERRRPSLRVRFWLLGWGLSLLHFVGTLVRLGGAERFRIFILICTVPLAAAAFLLSVSDRAKVRWLIASLIAPLIGYSALISWQVGNRWPYVVCSVCVGLTSAGFVFVRQRHWLTPQPFAWAALLFSAWVAVQVQGGGYSLGLAAQLILLYGLTGVLFWRRHPHSPATITVCAGFLAWMFVWIVRSHVPGIEDWVRPGNELRHVPSFVVAFGMILILVEEEWRANQAAKMQLQRFADVTSHLLSGVEVKAYCDQIATVIAEATTFQRVAILLWEEDTALFLAGQKGLAEPELLRLRAGVGRLTPVVIDELSARGRPMGKLAVGLEAEELKPYGVVAGNSDDRFDPAWLAGELVCIPLRPPRGGCIGAILLDSPREPQQVTAEELSPIEILAADIAVAADNAAMHRRLLLSEKMASVGQLVRGVAHEMNNPLTAVLGYAELLTDRSTDPEVRHGLDVIWRESRRIKSIVGNLVRFAQQNPSDQKTLNPLPLVQEVLGEKSPEARNRGIELVDRLAAALPSVVFDEQQLKQVFLNVLNNALDAVERAPEKRVTVLARAEHSRVVLSFIDTGPGFSDTSRVFDPFFTTKSPGKGTGLGLSVCYGVLRQHGGNITARNVSPTGACVTIELPAV